MRKRIINHNERKDYLVRTKLHIVYDKKLTTTQIKSK